MDCTEWTPVIRRIAGRREPLLARKVKSADLDAIKRLGLLGSKYIYLYNQERIQLKTREAPLARRLSN